MSPNVPLMQYVLGFHLQLHKTIDWYTTTTKPSSILLQILNLPRCILDQSRFTVLSSAFCSSGYPLNSPPCK